MAVTITISDVKGFCPAADLTDDCTIQLYIDASNVADECLDNNNVPNAFQRLLKLQAVCHQMTKASGVGQVKSQTDFEGASISYETYKIEGYGLESTTFGQAIKSSPWASCFGFLDTRSSRFMVSFGRTGDC